MYGALCSLQKQIDKLRAKVDVLDKERRVKVRMILKCAVIQCMLVLSSLSLLVDTSPTVCRDIRSQMHPSDRIHPSGRSSCPNQLNVSCWHLHPECRA